jgi:hypothetical protein
LISPKYNTWRWTTLPAATRLFSTMEKYSWSLPFFFRVVERRNIMALDYAHIARSGKRVGLHYSHFLGVLAGCCLANQALALRRFSKDPSNPRSRANVIHFTLQDLVDHFDIPEVPDIATTDPARYNAFVSQLHQLEQLTSNATPSPALRNDR